MALNDGMENKTISSEEFHKLAKRAALKMVEGDDLEIPMKPEKYGFAVKDLSRLAMQLYSSQAATHGNLSFLSPKIAAEFIAKVFLHGVIFARMEMGKSVQN